MFVFLPQDFGYANTSITAMTNYHLLQNETVPHNILQNIRRTITKNKEHSFSLQKQSRITAIIRL